MQRSPTCLQRFSIRSAAATCVLMLLSHALFAERKPMPPIVGKTLNGETINLPDRTVTKPVILVFGFAKSARDEGEAWGRQLIALQRKRNDFAFFQVAMLSGAPRFTHGLIRQAIRAAVPMAYHSHMLVATSDDDPWKDLLNVTNEASAYVVLCAPNGQILWQSRGTGATQFAELRAQLDQSSR